jgi:hypothetical protein
MARSIPALVLCLLCSMVVLPAWGGQGHRLVALVAANHLTGVAGDNVAWLIAPLTLPDIASWADEVQGGITQTSPWHYVNIPPDATAYDRDRDCPRQPGVAAGTRNDAWRDCIVDRIAYHEQRLADVRLDRADRAIALKFLVHFVGDVHQPLHASAIERGGNGIRVRVFGADDCGSDPARPSPCMAPAGPTRVFTRCIKSRISTRVWRARRGNGCSASTRICRRMSRFAGCARCRPTSMRGARR